MLTSNLNFYLRPSDETAKVLTTLMVYAAIAAVIAMLRFEKKDV
ncbi:MAG: hypothetical protein R2865_13145 [Deinococcales bacterium]